MFLSIYLSIHPTICLSIYLSLYLSIYPSIQLSIYLSLYLSIYLSFSLFHLSFYPSGVINGVIWFCRCIALSSRFAIAPPSLTGYFSRNGQREHRQPGGGPGSIAVPYSMHFKHFMAPAVTTSLNSRSTRAAAGLCLFSLRKVQCAPVVDHNLRISDSLFPLQPGQPYSRVINETVHSQAWTKAHLRLK